MGKQEGSFTVTNRDNLEVTHLNGDRISKFLEKNGYEITMNEVVNQEKISRDGQKAFHDVLYLIAKKVENINTNI